MDSATLSKDNGLKEAVSRGQTESRSAG